MAEKVYKNRVKENYEKEVVPYLVKKFNYKNVNEVPKLVKIVINSGPRRRERQREERSTRA